MKFYLRLHTLSLFSEMKILAINGSPRKKNTRNILDYFSNIKSKGNIEYEILDLQPLKLPLCLGCTNCIENGYEKCSHVEIMEKIRLKISSADGIIIGTPVYVNNITALLKNVIDHFAYLFHRPEYFEKKAMIIVSTQQTGGKDVRNYLKKTIQIWGMDVNNSYIIKKSSYQKNLKYKKTMDKKFQKGYKRLISDIVKKTPSNPSFHQLLSFQIFKILAEITKDDIPADSKHWQEKGWFEKDYYIPIRGKWLKKKLAKLLVIPIRRSIYRNQKNYSRLKANKK